VKGKHLTRDLKPPKQEIPSLLLARHDCMLSRVRGLSGLLYFFFAVFFFGVGFFPDFFTPHPGFPQDISHLS
jgi:hypothetical protein